MKLNKNDLVRGFQSLSIRERNLSIVTLFMVIIYCLYMFIYAPIETEKMLIEQKMISQTKLYDYLKTISVEVSELRNNQQMSPMTAETESLMTEVEASSVHMQIKPAIKSIISEGENKVNISIEEIVFDTLITWLIQLEALHGITVTNITIAALENKKGEVSTQILLSR